MCSARLEASSGLMAEGVPTNNQRGQRSGPYRLLGGLDKARHVVPTALVVRVQCFRKGLYKAVEGPSTRPIYLSMITGSYCPSSKAFDYFRTRRDEIRCVFDHHPPPPYFVNQITIEDRVRDSF